MTDPGGQGWRDDPTGRFRSRWHDGTGWTEHVVGPDGAVTTSPLSAPAQQPWQQQPWQQQPWQQQPWQPPQGAPAAQPAQQPWQPQPQPQPQPQGAPTAQPTWQQPPAQPAWGSPAAVGRPRYLPGPGIAVGALGLLCLVLSLFALDWADGGKSTFLDLAKPLRHVPDGVDLTFAQHIAVIYAVWAAFVLFGLAVVIVALAGIPFPASAAGNTYARIGGAVVAGLGAVGQITLMTQEFKGDPSPQFGAWLGLVGWFVVAAGFILGARRTTG